MAEHRAAGSADEKMAASGKKPGAINIAEF
jgi:hypothetical protein